ncbi:hypothetical protein MACH17_21320 [Phaeobacter inhibens]|uniref:hypothetical protein n=1 Tax=Phaeobacter inhibens TaxID=221822 RepID=UPI0027593049|nr:hypothetical protein [Phaeobacter inhibens]GLO70615.1 hypothetical protein MACH17_21320 [Phaeobacter inhibens]
MTPNHKQFEAAQREFAEQALAGLTDTTDPQAAAALKFAAKRAEEQASILMREAFERERA